MSLRPYLDSLKKANLIVEISDKIKLDYEVTDHLLHHQGKAVLFSDVEDSQFPLIGNLLSSRDLIKTALNVQENYYQVFQQALLHPQNPQTTNVSSTFDNSSSVDLSSLPIPKFFSVEAGKYLTSGIICAHFPDTGLSNMSIHRIMVMNANHGAVRLVPRDLFSIFNMNKDKGEDTPIAIVNGYHPLLALAASSPTPQGKTELSIANSLMNGSLTIVKSPKYGIDIPADVEFLLEGRILADETVDEGPFVDITGTADDVRKQPVIEIEAIYYRDNPLFQTILSASNEHFILMGFPREAEIHNRISSLVPKVHGVYLTPGGSGWLHAVIAITPGKTGDAEEVALAAFKAHPSLKWCTVVDEDIDIYNRKAVEWATITRAGANDITILEKMRGSSLDPSRNRKDNTSIKVIVDATKKEGKEGYERVIPF